MTLPSYNTIAARIGFDNDHYRVSLYGRTLSDSRGITSYVQQRRAGIEWRRSQSFNREPSA